MKTQRMLLGIALVLVGIIILVACGGEPEAIEEGTGSDASAEGSEGSGRALPPTRVSGAKVEVTRVAVETETVAEEPRMESSGLADAAAPPSVTPAATMAPSVETGVASEVAVASGLPLDQNSRLTAGEVDDNKDWDDYVNYLRNYLGAAVIRVDVSERHQLWVKDSQGNPVLGARISVEVDGQEVAVLRTHSDGRAFFFPRALGIAAEEYNLNIEVNGSVETLTISAGGSQREWRITHPAADQVVPAARLDVLFLIDATGSMADEINQLKENIRSISAQIDALPSAPDVRFGLVAYRDRSDIFVTRVNDFTPDIDEFAQILAEVRADGGGDYPEDLNEALSKAVHEPEWRVDGTVSLIFLVADAPPHLDYGQQNHYAYEMINAAARGIKIFPIASSGLDSQGEYIFRQLAQVTGGRFIFLTYGPEGPGTTGTETDFQVSDYTVASLDALVVRIVEEELAYLLRN